jgi:hypothetical protein
MQTSSAASLSIKWYPVSHKIKYEGVSRCELYVSQEQIIAKKNHRKKGTQLHL